MTLVSDFDYNIKIADHILDNIYGQIGLTEVEKRIERLPIFKRLHNLSQLGLVNWIFPCALHTRYTHSIGVMHVAGEMAKHININMNEAFFNDSEIQILRLAGLLHDIGHYPLSHNIEYAYKDAQYVDKYKREPVSQNLKHFVNCPAFLDPEFIKAGKTNVKSKDLLMLEAEANFDKGFSGSKEFHHEYIGHLIITHNLEIRKIIRDHFVLVPGTGDEPVLNHFFAPLDANGNKVKEVSDAEVDKIVIDLMFAIGHLVIGSYSSELDMQYPWLEKYSAMIQLIHSDLDADNIDYLLRDATFSGTSYGIMDMSVLLNCLYVKRFSNITIPTKREKMKVKYKYIVGVNKKGVGAVEQFLIGKFMAYSQMIFSKYVSILEAMIFYLESGYIIPSDQDYKGKLLQDMVSEKETSEKYLNFSDFYIFHKLYSLSTTIELIQKVPKAIITRLKHLSALDLAKCCPNECICVGTDTAKIIDEFSKNPLYKDFLNVYNTVKDLKGLQLSNGEGEEKLLSFRFEHYSLTNMIPLAEFEKKFLFNKMSLFRRFAFHYYRLGKGIPILDPQQEYVYKEIKRGRPDHNLMPVLCVDSALSMLQKMKDLQFVALRRYEISD